MPTPSEEVIVGSSSASTPNDWRIIVFGPPDRSKTFSSLTFSEKCPIDLNHIKPKVLKKREPEVYLDDLLWIAADKGATEGFRQQGIRVDKIDISNEDPIQWDARLPKIHAAIKREVESGRRKCLMIDTITSLDELFGYRAGVVKGLKKFEYYAHVADDHRRFYFPLKALPIPIIFLCHAKALMDSSATDEATTNMQRTRRAQGVSGVVPAIVGSSANLYKKDATFTFSVSREVVREPVPGVAHFFHPDHRESEAKTRLILPEKLPADWRVVKKTVFGG